MFGFLLFVLIWNAVGFGAAYFLWRELRGGKSWPGGRFTRAANPAMYWLRIFFDVWGVVIAFGGEALVFAMWAFKFKL